MHVGEFDYRKELSLILVERKSRNSSYSIRALARDLSISVTALQSVDALLLLPGTLKRRKWCAYIGQKLTFNDL
jgi:hypothetical protein